MDGENEEFESDPNKAAKNIKKHKKKDGAGLSFEEASEFLTMNFIKSYMTLKIQLWKNHAIKS